MRLESKMNLRYFDTFVLGLGLLVMGIITFFVLPKIRYTPLEYSPGLGYMSMEVYSNFVASGTLFVLGVMFVALAFWYNTDRGHGSRDLDM